MGNVPSDFMNKFIILDSKLDKNGLHIQKVAFHENDSFDQSMEINFRRAFTDESISNFAHSFSIENFIPSFDL